MTGELSPRRRALLERFTTGSLERIERMLQVLDDVAAGRSSPDQLRVFYREMHTLKGESRMMGFALLGDAAYHGELLLKSQETPPPAACTGLNRVLTAMAAVLREPGSEPSAAILRAAITAAPAEAGEVASDRPASVAAPPDRAVPGAAPGPRTGPRILLVDDSPVIRDLVSDILGRSGFQVTEAGDGQAALELIEALAPDLVLLDLDMPRMNGFQVLSRLRRRQLSCPVVMLTSHSSDDDRAQARTLGASDYLVKSDFADEELVGLVRRNLAPEVPS